MQGKTKEGVFLNSIRQDGLTFVTESSIHGVAYLFASKVRKNQFIIFKRVLANMLLEALWVSFQMENCE